MSSITSQELLLSELKQSCSGIQHPVKAMRIHRSTCIAPSTLVTFHGKFNLLHAPVHYWIDKRTWQDSA